MTNPKRVSNGWISITWQFLNERLVSSFKMKVTMHPFVFKSMQNMNEYTWRYNKNPFVRFRIPGSKSHIVEHFTHCCLRMAKKVTYSIDPLNLFLYFLSNSSFQSMAIQLSVLMVFLVVAVTNLAESTVPCSFTHNVLKQHTSLELNLIWIRRRNINIK